MPETPQDPNDWIRYSDVSERDRAVVRRHCAGSPAWRIGIACGAIALGVLLFLGNLGILPAYNVWVFWPLIPLAAGFARLSSDRASARIAGVFAIFIGAFFLARNLGWIQLQTSNSNLIVSLILIGIGCLALMNALDSSRGIHADSAIGTNLWRRGAIDHNTSLGDLAVLGSVKRKMDTTDFRGGDLTTILGNIEIDLRSAMISGPDRTAVLHATALFGAIKVRVPQEWRVHLRGLTVLGNFEDKTVPPNTGLNAPAIVITGWSCFGSVEIED